MSDNTWNGKGTGSPTGNKAFVWLIRHFGVLPAYLLLVPVCFVYALRDKKAKAALASLRTRLKSRLTFSILYSHLFCFGMSLVDRLAFLLLKRSPFSYSCINENFITDSIGKGKGVILLGAHLGNWEVAGNLLMDRIQTPVNVVMLDAERKELQEAYAPALDRRRVNIISISTNGLDTVVQALSCLRRNEILALLGDRVMDQESERIDFLGSPVAFPKGPFIFAALSGAPIIPVFALKTSLLRYAFFAADPITIHETDRDKRDPLIRQAMLTYVSVLEKTVREHPCQWFNFYDFWK